jgi:hypothetical protein
MLKDSIIGLVRFVMVSTDSLWHQKITTRYLHCKKCDGYYKLQEGEKLVDFSNCKCGGDLEYKPKME